MTKKKHPVSKYQRLINEEKKRLKKAESLIRETERKDRVWKKLVTEQLKLEEIEHDLQHAHDIDPDIPEQRN